mgnify:CR=1 FL=1|tara:strand:+ start:48 stop:179 length:132 start_codon:yes stop_codon:yes gene_type:complete
MNNWDKVEKKKRMVGESDLFWENIKMVVIVLIGITYLYFLFRG